MEGPQLMVLWDWLFQMVTFQKITETLTSKSMLGKQIPRLGSSEKVKFNPE